MWVVIEAPRRLISSSLTGWLCWLVRHGHLTNDQSQRLFLNPGNAWDLGQDPPVISTASGASDWPTVDLRPTTWALLARYLGKAGIQHIALSGGTGEQWPTWYVRAVDGVMFDDKSHELEIVPGQGDFFVSIWDEITQQAEPSEQCYRPNLTCQAHLGCRKFAAIFKLFEGRLDEIPDDNTFYGPPRFVHLRPDCLTSARVTEAVLAAQSLSRIRWIVSDFKRTGARALFSAPNEDREKLQALR